LMQRTITIRAAAGAEDSKEWTVAELGYRAEFAGVREEIAKLQEGELWDRAMERYRFEKSFTLVQSWNNDAFEAAVRKRWGWLESSEAKDASRVITDEDEVLYEPHIDAYRLDIEALSEKVGQWVMLEKDEIGAEIDQAFEAELPIVVVHPEVTLEKLKEEG